MTTDLYHLHFFLVFIYLYLLETLIFWTKCYHGNPLLQDFFSLSKRFTNPSLPHRGSAEPRPHIPLPRDKVVLAEAPSAGMFFRPCQGRPRAVLYCPLLLKKKRGMSVPFYGLADIDHAISKTRYNKLYLYSVLFKVDRLQITLVAIKYISTCRNCSSVGCLKCV